MPQVYYDIGPELQNTSGDWFYAQLLQDAPNLTAHENRHLAGFGNLS